MLNAHLLPFYEGQMHHFRLVPSYAPLWRMVRGLFNILVCLLPAYSLRFLRGFHHLVFDILYLEHLFLVNSPCCSHDGWRWVLASAGNLPYLLECGCFTPIYQICPKLSLGVVRKNKVNADKSLIRLFFPSLEKLREHHQPQGPNCFHLSIPFSDLTFLLTNLLFMVLSLCSSMHLPPIWQSP